MLFLAILFIGFFLEYAITPIYQVIGEGVFICPCKPCRTA